MPKMHAVNTLGVDLIAPLPCCDAGAGVDASLMPLASVVPEPGVCVLASLPSVRASPGVHDGMRPLGHVHTGAGAGNDIVLLACCWA